jgi:two-component system sensor histidine kinase/response regulator
MIEQTALTHSAPRGVPNGKIDAPPVILLVDDHLSLLTSLKFRLESYGYRVLTADNGRSALEVMAKARPDLIISDIMMPVMDGFDFFQAVRSDPRWLGVPFIFLSAKGAEDDMRYGKLLGAEEYIVKPFNPEDLRVAVVAKLRRARELQAHSQQEMETLKKRLIGVMSHEFKTPLSYIKLATEVLSKYGGLLTPEELEQTVHSIQQGERRLSGLIEDTLAVAAIDAGMAYQHYQVNSIPYSIASSVREAVNACRDQAAGRGIQVNVIPPADTLRVQGVEKYLTSVFTRLLSNAVKFSPVGGEVSVAAQHTDGQIAIAVRDGGRGIPAAELPRLFDRFYQVNREMYEQQGAGLGLTIARAYVELHGGRIEVTSQENVGSTFTVWLPLCSN